MIWTTEKPTKPGWYWWRCRGVQCVVEIGTPQHVIQLSSGLSVWFTSGSVRKLQDVDGEWAGPLEEPEEG